VKRYRIYTKASENLQELASDFFNGFSIFYGTEYYKGTPEECAIIEVIADDHSERLIFDLANVIKMENEQDSVMVTVELTDASLVL
jgi:hypothetical protein